MFRDLTLEYLNGFISWSRMEDECKVEHLMRDLEIVKAMRKRIDAKEVPTDQPSLQTLLDLSTEDVTGAGLGKRMTLLEAMGLRSLAALPKRGPQPVVAAKDQGQEIAGD
jgi:hypothetical protein